ncbi:alpha/beta hydrolase [Acidaminobacter hydrogenoformans]|uniref:Predicted hydrolase of the alpha/beta superfamily n=1 Tax=Acidaminobacter hydrogenoformans DSM 2784 TaxID=1120920 RepID=A0A1G5RPP7_9FIRM|nr:alpha/beta hydrolase-fold protein [Acidaminobacter hydrogenoformans]SCZ75966.1 Predicted hydrolase of the alpha/beta superfamily [Acidaminobacter hydrogenoformans DSM 2784]
MKDYSQPDCNFLHRFYSRALDNFRSLYIYLPPSYKTDSERLYPVLYMHDGQNIFGGEESYSGMGWEIHQTADDLIRGGAMEEIVIVGIANIGAERLSEYAHYDFFSMGKSVQGRGELYEQFVLEDVMPFVEANFRVLTGPENTGLMGSSMGGLVTFMMGTRHPDVFGRLGIVSPSFWWSPKDLLPYVDSLKPAEMPERIWIDMGDTEGGLKEGFDAVLDRLLELRSDHKASFDMEAWVVPGGKHSEYDWQMRAHCPLLYLFGDIGSPVALELHAPETIALGDQSRFLRPVLTFDSGFCVTPFEAACWSSAPEVLSLGWNLQLFPNTIGKAILHGACQQLTAAWSCTVIEPAKPSAKRRRHKA